ncbi:AAA family ATPase, partial [Candidatus Calescamantes bacterium]|nr:AAA family ATPase [Candidatus Calescamantes bacterium]
VLNGRYLRNELSQYLFNNEVVNEYINSLKTDNPQPPPYILIEVFFDDIDFPMFEGNGNSEKIQECGLAFKIKFDDGFKDEYEDLITPAKINTIPVEYYKISWKSFAREPITSRSIPLKSVVIDSSSYRYQNGSDVYISRIIRDDLEISEKVNMAQAYRMLKEEFSKNDAIKEINRKITEKTKVSNKNLHISVDLSSSNSWETVLMTYLDEIPFHQIGKGEQCIIKTSLALEHEKSEEANMILIEELECHLSHTKLNQLLKSIRGKCDEKQILISTHSSFVANKLGLEHLIFLSNSKVAMLKDLTADTQKFFQKLPGYQTLRLILCQKALLVEGPSDELIVQKAYMKNNEGRLPIEEGIDVISVGLSFKRFLEIAKKLKHPVAVITDNDGDYDVNIIKKYADYSSE